MRDVGRAIATLSWLLIIAMASIAVVSVCHDNRLDDLEQRMIALETIRIEAVAPPEGVSP